VSGGETGGRVRVVVADDQRAVLDGLALMLGLMPGITVAAVVVLTTYADDTSVLEALRAGARGFLTKNAGRADIARAIAAAGSGPAAGSPRDT